MPYNETLPDYYVDADCKLIGKAADGTYDLGSTQQMSASECASALANWEDFVKNYGDKFGIKKEGKAGEDSGTKKGSGIFGSSGASGFFNIRGGLFHFLGIGLGLVGNGTNDDDPPGINFFDVLIIAAIVLAVILFIRRK